MANLEGESRITGSLSEPQARFDTGINSSTLYTATYDTDFLRQDGIHHISSDRLHKPGEKLAKIRKFSPEQLEGLKKQGVTCIVDLSELLLDDLIIGYDIDFKRSIPSIWSVNSISSQIALNPYEPLIGGFGGVSTLQKMLRESQSPIEKKVSGIKGYIGNLADIAAIYHLYYEDYRSSSSPAWCAAEGIDRNGLLLTSTRLLTSKGRNRVAIGNIHYDRSLGFDIMPISTISAKDSKFSLGIYALNFFVPK